MDNKFINFLKNKKDKLVRIGAAIGASVMLTTFLAGCTSTIPEKVKLKPVDAYVQQQDEDHVTAASENKIQEIVEETVSKIEQASKTSFSEVYSETQPAIKILEVQKPSETSEALESVKKLPEYQQAFNILLDVAVELQSMKDVKDFDTLYNNLLKGSAFLGKVQINNDLSPDAVKELDGITQAYDEAKKNILKAKAVYGARYTFSTYQNLAMEGTTSSYSENESQNNSDQSVSYAVYSNDGRALIKQGFEYSYNSYDESNYDEFRQSSSNQSIKTENNDLISLELHSSKGSSNDQDNQSQNVNCETDVSPVDFRTYMEDYYVEGIAKMIANAENISYDVVKNVIVLKGEKSNLESEETNDSITNTTTEFSFGKNGALKSIHTKRDVNRKTSKYSDDSYISFSDIESEKFNEMYGDITNKIFEAVKSGTPTTIQNYLDSLNYFESQPTQEAAQKVFRKVQEIKTKNEKLTAGYQQS